jgi:competence protein ComEC
VNLNFKITKKSLYRPIYLAYEIWSHFWTKHPALAIGIAFLGGVGYAFGEVASLLPVILIIIGMSRLRLVIAIGFALFGHVYTNYAVHFPKGSIETIGWIKIRIERTYDQTESFQNFRVYDGKVVAYAVIPANCVAETDDMNEDPPEPSRFRELGLPVKLKVPIRQGVPPADRDYLVKGLITIDSSNKVMIRPQRDSPWIGVDESPYRFGEIRYQIKQWVRKKIETEVSDSRSAELLAALATGDLADRKLVSDFRKLGLLHLLAISGFHFSLLASVLHFALRFWVTPKNLSIWLTLILSSYFIFLGASPSIMRAWMSAMIYLIGQMIHREAIPLNSLGVAILVTLLVDPTSIGSIGFQLSFAATAAILLLCEPIDNYFRERLRVRSLTELIPMPAWQQHLYVMIGFIRGTLALNIAVTVITLPILLERMGSFPIATLAYNLFFPFLLSFSLLMLPLSFLVPPLHWVNGWYTGKLLEMTEIPGYAAPVWELSDVSMLSVIVIPLVVLMFLGAILWKGWLEKVEGSSPFLSFV